MSSLMRKTRWQASLSAHFTNETLRVDVTFESAGARRRRAPGQIPNRVSVQLSLRGQDGRARLRGRGSERFQRTTKRGMTAGTPPLCATIRTSDIGTLEQGRSVPSFSPSSTSRTPRELALWGEFYSVLSGTRHVRSSPLSSFACILTLG